MLSNLPCASQLSVCLFWENVYSVPLNILLLSDFFKMLRSISSFVHFGYQPFIRYITCKYFLVYSRLPFDCDGISFIVQMPFQFDVVPFVYFCLCFPWLRRHIQKILLKPMSKGIMPIFSSRRLVVLHFTCKIFIHFEFIFVPCLRKQSSLILLHIAVQLSQHYLLKKLSFSHCIFLPPLSQINCTYKSGFIIGLSVMFHGSMCLFHCAITILF